MMIMPNRETCLLSLWSFGEWRALLWMTWKLLTLRRNRPTCVTVEAARPILRLHRCNAWALLRRVCMAPTALMSTFLDL